MRAEISQLVELFTTVFGIDPSHRADAERMTRVWVVAPWLVRCTPRSNSPSVMPVAEKNMFARLPGHGSRTSLTSILSRSTIACSSSLRIQSRALNCPTDTGQRRCRNHRFRRPADAHEHIDSSAWDGGHDGARNISIGNQLDAGTRGPHFGDEIFMTRPIENNDNQILDPLFQRARNACEVLAGDRSISMTSAASGPTAIFCI